MASGGIRRAPRTVGRDAELARLHAALAPARAGGAAGLLLVGEGGIGKTRLVGEAAAYGRELGLPVLSGRAPITSPVAFGVVAEALRSYLRQHPLPPEPSPYDAGLRLVLPERPAAASDLTPAQLRLLALEGIVHVARRIAAAHGGLLVLLDDLHAADAESVEAARYLAAAQVPGCAVVGALRPGESAAADDLVRGLRPAGAEVLPVGALDEAGVREMLAGLLGAPPPQPLLADILARTGGLPLFVEEVLDAHLLSGSLELTAGGPVWHGGAAAVPRTVREMVGARLERIGRPRRDVVLAGAVAGDFDDELLAAVAATDPAVVHDALADGLRAGLLEATAGTLAFRHALVREAVLATAVPHLVGLMHRRAAAALAAGPADAQRLERRAGHLAAVGDGTGAAALLAEAARAGLGAHALLDAERLARAAVAAAAGGEAAPAADDALARALAAQGRWAEALAVDGAAATARGETAAVRLRVAGCALEAGRPELAREVLARAAAAGDSSRDLDLVAGRTALVQGDAVSALACAGRVLGDPAAGPDARLAALDLQARALDYRLDRAGAIAAWERQAAEAAAAGRTQARLRAVVALGKIELFDGRPPVRLHEAVTLARSAGALVELAWAQENLAIALAIQGDPAAARAVLDEAIPRARELRLDQLAYLLMADGAVRGYTEDAEAVLAEAERLAPTDDLRLHTTAIRAGHALCAGRYAEGLHRLEECLAIWRSLPGVVPIDAPCWLPWALAVAGRPGDAQAALGEARAMPDLARWYGRPVLVAAAEALLAGDAGGVEAVFAAAPATMPYDLALMRVLAAEVLGGPAAPGWLRAALATYEAGGSTLPAAYVRSVLRAVGAPVPRRRRAADVPADLAARGVTAREADVLRLLGEGLTNAEIGARLHLSVRTVESYVSALLAKLGARTRGQLTARHRAGRD